MAGRNPDSVQASKEILIQRYFPWIGGAALTGCAVFSYPGRVYVLVGLMLFLPLIDRRWTPPVPPRRPYQRSAWLALVMLTGALLAWQPDYLKFALATLLLAALPEEWFFRAWFMTRLGNGWHANLTASLLFSLLHGLSRDWQTALMVYPASLFYGWLYQRTRDLPLLILVHMLSNLVFMLFLARYIAEFQAILR